MQAIDCTIEILSTSQEICWFISIPSQNVTAASLLFSALHLGLIPHVFFQDPHTKKSVTVRPDSVSIENQLFPSAQYWFDALWHLLVNTALNGWTDTAHLDKTIPTENGEICLTFTITP